MSTTTNKYKRKKVNPHSRKSLSTVPALPKEDTGSRITDIPALRSAFTTTPPPSATIGGSVYVSGHLTPADQWVAVAGASESSGVISLTTSDNEDEEVEEVEEVGAQYKQIRHDSAHPPYLEEERAVSLLRESVASLLTSSGGGSPVSAGPAGRMKRRGSTGGYIRRDSPDIRSKISEPCYAANRRPGFNIERFTDINLSATAAAPMPAASMPAPTTTQPPLPYISNSASEITSKERSPFASLRTISPVIMESDALVEAMLEKTILCPIPDDRHSWTRYTGYAVAGFGVGTLVGMLCLDIAASSASVPRATKTVPLSGL